MIWLLQVVEEQQGSFCQFIANRHNAFCLQAFLFFLRAAAQITHHPAGSPLLLLPQPADDHPEPVCMLPHGPLWPSQCTVPQCTGGLNSNPQLQNLNGSDPVPCVLKTASVTQFALHAQLLSNTSVHAACSLAVSQVFTCYIQACLVNTWYAAPQTVNVSMCSGTCASCGAGQLALWVLGARHERSVLHWLASKAGHHSGYPPHDPHLVSQQTCRSHVLMFAN